MASGGGRGGEVYDADGIREAYLRHRHDGTRSPNSIMEEPAFLEALGSIDGFRVLDLGCGDSSTARLLLTRRIASYVGIDGSEGMVEAARSVLDDPRAQFVHADIEDADMGEGAFDAVVARMSLHYVEHLGAVFERVSRALVPGGRFVFSVVHPVITSHDHVGDGPRTAWTVDDYFDRGPRQRTWFGATVTWQHRTIEDLVCLVVGHGFRLDTLNECEPRAELLAGDPDELARRRRVPLMVLIGATRS